MAFYQAWSEVLCSCCNKLFSATLLPISPSCGHMLCELCTKSETISVCPIDMVKLDANISEFPINLQILSLVSKKSADEICEKKGLKSKFESDPAVSPIVAQIEQSLFEYSSFLHLEENAADGQLSQISSNCLSRTVQRKIFKLLCNQMFLPEGRRQTMQDLLSLTERIVAELIGQIQSGSVSISTNLWAAVRSRGCQFLGPAMQEDVLKLTCNILSKGELISRKKLVMHVVQKLSNYYSHVSKTCVGHVVQLLYRASCFNVIKCEGESSLMQLKPEFRDFEALRSQHDSQIIQIAQEAGLRISPEQWSTLLYGDLRHRLQMQSICDRINVDQDQKLVNIVNELHNMAEGTEYECVFNDAKFFANFDPFIAYDHMAKEKSTIEDVDWESLRLALSSVKSIVAVYASIIKLDPQRRCTERKYSFSGQVYYKTKMCNQIINGLNCHRGNRCTFAHNQEELRNNNMWPRPQSLLAINARKPMAEYFELVPSNNRKFNGYEQQNGWRNGQRHFSPSSFLPAMLATTGYQAKQSSIPIPITMTAPMEQPTFILPANTTLEQQPQIDYSSNVIQIQAPAPIFEGVVQPPPTPTFFMFGSSPPSPNNVQYSESQFSTTAQVLTTTAQLIPSSPPSPQQQLNTYLAAPPTLFGATTQLQQIPAQPVLVQPFGSPPIYPLFASSNWTPLLGSTSPSSPTQGGFINYGIYYNSLDTANDLLNRIRRLSTRSDDLDESHISYNLHSVANSVANSVLLEDHQQFCNNAFAAAAADFGCSLASAFATPCSPTILGPVSEIPNCAGCSAADLLKDAVLPVTVQSCNNGMKAQVVDAFEPHVSAKICSPQQLVVSSTSSSERASTKDGNETPTSEITQTVKKKSVRRLDNDDEKSEDEKDIFKVYTSANSVLKSQSNPPKKEFLHDHHHYHLTDENMNTVSH